MKPVYKAHFSLWREKWKILIAMFFLAVSITAFLEPENKQVFGPLMSIFVIIVIWILIDFLRYKLVLTETILKGTESIGLFGKSVSLPLKQISAVEVYQKGFGKVLNYGTVTVTTASGIVAFKYVKNPHEVENEILKAI